MKLIKNVYDFYAQGFKSMTTGKTLWRLIFIKVAVILIVLNYFVYDRSIDTEYENEAQKIEFVHGNLVGKSR